jgi:hypothetical protein
MCKEAHDQRQMMNLMFMIMLNKNGGGATATGHLAPAPTTLRIYINNCLLIY